MTHRNDDILNPEIMVWRALRFAAHAHRHQFRSSDGAPDERRPYIDHPLHVISTLHCAGVTSGFTWSVAALHDVLEDTKVTFEELREEFGPLVAAIVLELTLPPDINGKIDPEKKREYQVKAAHGMSSSAALIKIADKISNVSSLRTDPPSWGRKAQIGYIESARQVVEAAYSSPNHDTVAIASADRLRECFRREAATALSFITKETT